MTPIWRLPPGWDDDARLASLAAEWRSASPFPHLVVDDLVSDAAMPALLEILAEEPIDLHQADIYAFEASAPEPKTAALRQLREEFASMFARPLERITGKALRRADMRAYAYRAGHYLLPHTDHRDAVGRAIAFAYYVPSPEPPEDGSLELYRCTRGADETLVEVESARVLAPRDNRIVVFDVSDVSLHQVREVLSGLRISLSGWFYP